VLARTPRTSTIGNEVATWIVHSRSGLSGSEAGTVEKIDRVVE
jgi:hypothetical protein